jgi:nucleoside-diphosphate-sugar epimerase
MQAVIPKLLAQGHDITGVDNLYRHGVKSSSAGVNYKFINLDLTNTPQTLSLCQGYDVVFLAAAKIYGIGGFNHYCADILSDDIAIQGNIFRSCALNKQTIQRVVYISSSMVYETCIQDINHPVTEDLVDNCITPKTEYGISKLIGERICQAFKKQYNIDYTIWRPFNIITPEERAMTEQGFSHVFADFIDNILIKKLNPLPIFGSGDQVRCFTWIDDVAEIIANYSFDIKTINEVFNIANVEPITMKALAEKIYSFGNNPELLRFTNTNAFNNDVLVRVPSIKKLESIIGSKKFQTIDESIRECINVRTDIV